MRSFRPDTFLQDLRFAARTYGRSPGFAAIAVVTLALGIGANAAIFSVVNAVLLKRLPWPDPDRAVMIWSRWTAFDKTWVAAGEVVDYRRRATSLSGVAAWADGQDNLTGDGEPERVAAGAVTANTFAVLGVTPLLGRTFSAQEHVPNGPRVVVLGSRLWERRYGADPSIVGRSISIKRAGVREEWSPRWRSRCPQSESTACSPIWSAGARARSASVWQLAPAGARSCAWSSRAGSASGSPASSPALPRPHGWRG